jgi:hypothetical protein
MRTITPDDATLLDILIDGFEKNEINNGFHWRVLPLLGDEAAARKFTSLLAEASHWQGEPERVQDGTARQIASWPKMEIRRAGRSVLVRVRAPLFHSWWHDEATWEDDPTGAIFDWVAEEQQGT